MPASLRWPVLLFATGWVALLGIESCGGRSRLDDPLAGVDAGWSSTEITIRKVGDGAGRVWSVPHAIECGDRCAGTYAGSPPVAVEATAADGSRFVGWEGANCDGTEPCVVTSSGRTELTAHFARVPVAEVDAGGCPAPTPDGTRFVDHALGTDDDAHGTAGGACAFRTVAYALGHARNVIVLAPGEYSALTPADPPPYVLQGTQSLQGDLSDPRLVVIKPVPASSNAAAVQFAGTRNGVDHCLFEGPTGRGLMGIEVDMSPADPALPHLVRQSEFRGMTWGVLSWKGGVSFDHNTFREAPNGAIEWAAGDAPGSITNNDFIANGRDIACSTTSSLLVGSGNVRGGGSPICSNCAGCPF